MSNKQNSCFWIGAAALAAIALLLLLAGEAQPKRDLAPALAIPTLFGAAPGCALTGEQARAHAFDRERGARARWERVPYAVNEGPNAVRELGEAIQCFRSAGDREGRARAESDLTVWKREIERLYARTQLNLTLALRAKDAQASSTEAKALLALLQRSGEVADPYRSFLRNIERTSRAALIERLRASEED